MARLATDQDFLFVKHAWSACFDDPEQFVDWNFQYNYHKENTLIAESEGKPASNMQLMPYTINLNGTPTRISYISGVATLPEYRNRGLVRDLFQTGFELMRSRGIAVSLLVPFNYPFYEKFGYKQCYDKPEYTATPPDSAETLNLTDLEQCIPALNKLYTDEMRGKNGYILRSHRDWFLILDDLRQNSNGRVYLHKTAGTIDGYVIFADEKIHECCGAAPFPYQLSLETPFAMARIVDAPSVLAVLAQTFTGSLGLRITDGQIPENNRCFQIRSNTVTVTDGYDISVDIQTLAQLAFGYIDDCTGSGLFHQTENYINLLL